MVTFFEGTSPTSVTKGSSASITLTLSSGATYNNDLSVTVGGTAVSVTPSISGSTISFTLSAVSGAVVITASATGGSTGDSDTGSGDSSTTTWYIDHRDQVAKATSSVNVAGRGWCHVPGTDAHNAYVGKPVNTLAFFTNLESQSVVIGKVTKKGGVDDMEIIATVTATNPSGTTKGLCTITFPTVTLAADECLMAWC